MSQTTTTQTTTEEQQGKKKLNLRFLIVLAILVIGGGAFGISKYLHGQKHEETDDAQIDAGIAPVIPRVAGYINEVRVKDNQVVKKGDTLIVLDDRDLRNKLQQAQAALAAAQSGLGVAEATTEASRAAISTTEANVATANAQIEAARVNLWRANQDYERYANLIKDHSVTQHDYETALAAKQSAERQLAVLTEQRNAASRQTGAASSQSAATARQISVANATIQQRQVDVENALLNLSYTVITAPANGRVSRIGIQPGQYLNAGQSLFQVVLDESVWVVANFKETQMSKMKEGQRVTMKVDAYPGHEFEGRISSFSPATGSRFSLLPADNASGNFVKVVSRVPVRIDFSNAGDAALKSLRPGMNVDVDVHVQ